MADEEVNDAQVLRAGYHDSQWTLFVRCLSREDLRAAAVERAKREWRVARQKVADAAPALGGRASEEAEQGQVEEEEEEQAVEEEVEDVPLDQLDVDLDAAEREFVDDKVILAELFPQGFALRTARNDRRLAFAAGTRHGLTTSREVAMHRSFGGNRLFHTELLRVVFAFEEPNVEAIFEEGRQLYNYGYPPPEDQERGGALLEEAAAMGYPPAVHLRGLNYFFGEGGVQRNYLLAAQCFLLASSRFHYAPSAYYFARVVEYRSAIVPCSTKYTFDSSFRQLQEACDSGDADMETLYMAGRCYVYQHGTSDDPEHRAVDLFQRASDLGHVEAAWKLARCYIYGWGVVEVPDREKALMSFFRAAELGHTRAEQAITALLE